MEDKEKQGIVGKNGRISSPKNMMTIAVIGVIAVIAIIVIMVMIIRKPTAGAANSEQAMTQLVTEYYERDIKGKVIGINQQKVTLDALERAGFDISKVTQNKNYEKTSAYSLVIIENPNEIDPSKIVYRVENHLNGV